MTSTRFAAPRRVGAAWILSLVVLSGCGADQPTSVPIDTSTVTQAGTRYNYTSLQGLQSTTAQPFSGFAKTGDPFYGGVNGESVYLRFPASSGGDPAVCNAGSSEPPSTGAWGAYAGVWRGTFSVAPKGQLLIYHMSFNATREDGTGWISLVVNSVGVKTNDNLTLTFTNVVGLVSAYSTPTGSFFPTIGPFDPQDRCLTFSITATP